MAIPKMIGSINCYSKSPAKFRGKSFFFDGTTLGLVRTVAALGAKPGDRIEADFGGGMKPMVIYANSLDDRVAGLWAK